MDKQEFLNMFWECLKNEDIRFFIDDERVDGEVYIYPIIRVYNGVDGYNGHREYNTVAIPVNGFKIVKKDPHFLV